MKTSNVMAFIGGAIAGAAVALLLAPDKGEVTRRRIKEFVEDEVEKVKKNCKCGCNDAAEDGALRGELMDNI